MNKNTAATAALGESMDETTTLPAADFPEVIREGCAMVLTRDSWCMAGTQSIALTAVEDGRVRTNIGAAHRLDGIGIDLTRASGQWAVACWLVVGADRDWSDADDAIVNRALVGLANPADLRRVALEVRGG